MSDDPRRAIRARAILPISQAPIPDGVIVYAADKILQVGAWSDLQSEVASLPVEDLGDYILLPGLINAHCHLDYTGMAGAFPPTKDFTSWLKSIIALKQSWSNDDFLRSWKSGAEMLLRSGTTTVANIESTWDILMAARASTPLRVVSLLEMTGVKDQRTPDEILAEATALLEKLPISDRGLSPHSLYSTVPGLIEGASALSDKQRLPISIHLAESLDEFRMFENADGPMFDWLAGFQRNMSDCGHSTPTQRLANLGALSERQLAVHANYLTDADMDLLAATNTTVVHCPNSHAFFEHEPFPYAALYDRGVRVCLGTDSLATTRSSNGQPPQLNMFDEMREFRRQYKVESAEVLRMATLNGAQALAGSRSTDRGKLESGMLADLIALPFTGSIDDAEAAAVEHRGNVARTMIAGQWI